MNKKTISTIALTLMSLFSFAGLLSLFGATVNLTSLTLLIGIVAYFVTRTADEKKGFSFKDIPGFLKDWKTDILLVMPLVMNFICYILAKAVLPEFLAHLLERISFISLNTVVLLVLELLIAALGEEIAWRGFYQTRLSKIISFPAALICTAFLFSICHFASGSLAVVLYDLVFIFINAIFYGLLYKRTGNILISTLSHFLANLFGIFGLFLIL